MAEKKPSSAVRKYLENATPEEQQEFSEALLSRQSGIGSDQHGVPPSVVSISRLVWLMVVVLSILAMGWREDAIWAAVFLVVLGAVAWFPNETAAATGRLGVGTAVSRPSHPWVLFVVAWLFLLLIGVVATLKLFGAA